MSSSVGKIVSERNHRALMELVMKPGNDVCADCKARSPRWTSYNLGIFICMNCASIHRKIGTHITKVKSMSLDEWTKEQVEVMREKGNVKSNALYNPNETRHPPPTNMIDSERDSELERFIRSKYEFKRFMERKPPPQEVPVPLTRPVDTRSRPTPKNNPAQIERNPSPGPPLPPKTPQNMPPRLCASGTIPSPHAHNVHPPPRSASQPLLTLPSSGKHNAAPTFPQSYATQPSQKPAGQVWDDLVSLQGPSQSYSLPLQYQQPQGSVIPTYPSQPLQPQHTLAIPPNPFTNLSIGQANTATPMVASPLSMTSGQQFFYASQAPLPSPALHVGSTNPFNQAQTLPSAPAAVNGTSFSPSTNPFSQSHGMATAAQHVMALPTGMMMQQQMPPFPQCQTPSLPFPTNPGVSFSPSSGSMSQNPHFPTVSPQMPMATNPFSGAPLGQAPLQPAFGTTPFATQQQQVQFQQQPQQPLGQASVFGGWAGQGMQGTF